MRYWIRYVLIYLVTCVACTSAVKLAAAPDRVDGNINGAMEASAEEAASNDSDVQTPVAVEEPVPVVHLTEGAPWSPPDYSNQEKAVGYKAEDFQVFPGLKDRVQFWVDIYTKMTSNQGILHDSQYLNLIYEHIDFAPIMMDGALSDHEKYRAKQKLVKQKKKEIADRLKRLDKIKSPEGLDAEDMRYWTLFAGIGDKHKFTEAAKRGRLRFQLGQKDFFVKGIYYSGRYLKEMERIFREEGVPVQLTRLPFVESSFNIYARSKVGASGIWQFMRGTGRRYMKVGYIVDERNDPLTATRAAAKMLRQNYEFLQSWPLAITAYNHGAAGVMKVSKRCNSKDICELIEKGESRRFGFASKNFYASFLAAVEVEGHAPQYFGADLKRGPEVQYETVQLIKPLSFRNLLEVFDGDQETAELYNPYFTQSIRKSLVSIPKGTTIRVPLKKTENLLQVINGIHERPATAPAVASDSETVYQINSGDTLSGISVMFGVPVRRILDANDVDPKHLKPGQKLVIPVANNQQ